MKKTDMKINGLIGFRLTADTKEDRDGLAFLQRALMDYDVNLQSALVKILDDGYVVRLPLPEKGVDGRLVFADVGSLYFDRAAAHIYFFLRSGDSVYTLTHSVAELFAAESIPPFRCFLEFGSRCDLMFMIC
jgi:hypothetical protein